ncbi:MAG: TonB-dependent receptor, partial [Methyloglobulus sp.]|nr:TonB-dependent receptor [Methyloglobulus sp.]
ALTDFADQSDIKLVYNADLVRGIKSPPLNGRVSVVQGFNTLLKGSNLNYRMVGNNTVVIEHKPTAQPAEPKPNSGDVGGDTTLPKVTVEADASYDPDWAKDPYNPDYVLPNATTGTKTDTPIMETPLNVQVISKQVLKDQQVISLDKALRNVSGVTTSGTTSLQGGLTPNTGQTLFLRGFQSNTIFRNGFRMDGNTFGNGTQFANVESVEVLKGPAAILYGRVEPGGMVNVATKQPRATPYYSFNQQFGSYDLYRTSLDATGPLTQDDTLLYRVNTSFQSNNSYRDLVSGEDVFFAPTLKWNISPRTQATLEFEYNRELSSAVSNVLPVVSEKPAASISDIFGNGKIIDIPHHLNYGERNPVTTENIFVGLNWSHQFNDDWSIKHQVAFKEQDSLQGLSAYPLDFNGYVPNKVARLITFGRNTTDTVATNLDLTGHFKTWGLEHTLLVGGDYYRYDSLADSSTGHLFSLFGIPGFAPGSFIDFNNPIHPGTNVDGIVDTGSKSMTSTDNYGVYLQDQIKLPYDVHVMGGLRYQYVHSTTKNADTSPGADGVFSADLPQTDDAVTPRVGLLWQPKKWLSLYSNYVENFGANTGVRTFVEGSTVGKPVPAQSGQQWEVGTKIALFDGRFRASLAYYDLKKQNVPVSDFDQTHQCGNGAGSCNLLAGEARSRGTELDIQGEILPGWNVVATYTNQDARITKGSDTPQNNPSSVSFIPGNRLQYVPRNVGSFWTTYEVQQGDLKGFKIGGGVNLEDSRVSTRNDVTSKGFVLVGLMTGYSFDLGKQAKINLQLNVDNLLDETYYTNALKATEIGQTNGIAIVTFSTPRTFMGSINVEY